MNMVKMSPSAVVDMARALFREERARKRLDGWFLLREAYARNEEKYAALPPVERAANLLYDALKELPISISEHALFAGTQRDAFARSYALINPSFRVETFAGYCDPTAVFGDIEPSDEFPPERIEAVKAHDRETPYVRALNETYQSVEKLTGEVAFFMEQVTGHIVPDVRPFLARGVGGAIRELSEKIEAEVDPEKASGFRGMRRALEAAVMLAGRYAALADDLARDASGDDRARLLRIRDALRKVPEGGASNLYEAIQSFMILWQVMCAEQAPNPFAFSVGNADRILPCTPSGVLQRRRPQLGDLAEPDRRRPRHAGQRPDQRDQLRAPRRLLHDEPAPADSVGQAAQGYAGEAVPGDGALLLHPRLPHAVAVQRRQRV